MAASFKGLAVVALMSLAASAAAAEPRVAPSEPRWTVGDGFDFAGKAKKTRRSLSGIACPATLSGEKRCLAIFDEGGEARYVTLKDGAALPEAERVVLRRGKTELDAEGAATDGRYYYVTGSHSAKRGDCKSNPDSRRLIRFRLDPQTGRGLRDSDGRLAGFEDTDALWRLMARLPGLARYVGEEMCLGSEPPPDARGKRGMNGVNIEGLAVRDGRLFFGFRGPAIGGQAAILSVDADALFADRDPKPRLSWVAVSQGRAIRDMIAVEDGFLLLVGPDDTASRQGLPFSVMHWDGRENGELSQPKPLATLDLDKVKLRGCDDEIKPEAIAVLEDRPGAPYHAVIFSDGLCDGGPLGFSIPR